MLTISALVLVFSLCSCSFLLDDTYVVWTDSATVTEFDASFNIQLNDGMYIKIEIPNSNWNSFQNNLTSEGKHRWSQKKIYDYFIGRGFGHAEATKESSWLTTVDHGFIVS